LLFDLPDKVVMTPNDLGALLGPELGTVLGATEREMLIVSPYFIPGAEGVKFFQRLRKRGLRVIIVTNSLAATDVAAVHAGYRRYRKALLRAGVELYEFKATAANKKVPLGQRLSAGSGLGISRVSLHTKTFIFDERRVLVGSLNLDPRSTLLNTEIGVVFDVPELAASMSERVKQDLLSDSYRLEFIPSPGPCKECGSINWVSEENGQKKRYTREPGAGFARRLLVAILSFLPIERQL
jgi:putative cardiolipin synthase